MINPQSTRHSCSPREVACGEQAASTDRSRSWGTKATRRIWRSIAVVAATSAILLVGVNTICLSQVTDPNLFKSKGKKIVEIGWDIPTATYIRDNITAMETKPFDGVCFRINDDEAPPLAFEKRYWTESEMNFPVLGQIAWGNKLTNNFLQLWGQSKDNAPDWYDDELWNMVVANMKLFSKALKLSRSKGVFFDPEFYFHNETHSPWIYNSTVFPGKNFTTVKSKVRQRGREFIVSLQTEMPNLEFLSYYLLGIAWAQSEQSVDNLPNASYALLPAFVDGMLDGATKGAVFIEGNEGSYGYDETRKFSQGYNYIKNASTGAINLLAADVRDKFRTQGQVAMALYIDQLYGRYGGGGAVQSPAYYNSWFSHNVYNGMLIADQYVWCYSEDMDWWNNINLPVDISSTLRTVKTKFTQGQSLGFDMVKFSDYWGSGQATLVSSPTVNIASPRNNDITSSAFRITVETSQPVSKIEFYVNSTKVGEDSSSPYTFDTINLAAGGHTLFAMAFAADGNHTSSNPVNIDVKALESGSIYELEPKNAAGKRLDVSGVGVVNGSPVQIWRDNNGNNQRWKLAEQGTGIYELTPQHAVAQRLDVNGASRSEGAKVQIWSDNNSNAQRWKFELQTDGTYEIIPQHDSSKRLKVNAAGTTDGTAVQSWTDDNSDALRWKLLKQ